MAVCYNWETHVSEIKKTHMLDLFVCVCVCVCARACVRHRTSNISLIQSVQFEGSVMRIMAAMPSCSYNLTIPKKLFEELSL